MNGSGTFGIGRARGDYPLRILPLRAASPCALRNFHGERESVHAREREIAETTDAENASRFETAAVRISPAPRLSSAFAAQVLGQILMKSEDKAGSPPYRQPVRAIAHACDLSV